METPTPSRGKKKFIYLGLRFLLIFISFSVTQNLQTNKNGNEGFWSLALLYIIYACSTFIAPSIISLIGVSKSMLVGFLGYSAFIAANIFPNAILLYVGAALCGFGSGLVWTSQGVFVSKWSGPNEKAKNNGMFFALFFFNQLVGNLGIAVLYEYVDKDAYDIYIFSGLTVLALLASFSFVFQKDPPNVDTRSFKIVIFDMFVSLKKPKLLLLLVMFIFAGVSQSFTYGVYTKIIGRVADRSVVLYTMCIYGTSAAICSLVGGYINWKISIGLGTLIDTAAYASLFYFGIEMLHDNIWSLYLVGAGFGVTEGLLATVINGTIGDLFEGKEAGPFSTLWTVKALASGCMFILGIYIDYRYLILGNMGCLSVASILFVISRCTKPHKEEYFVLSKENLL
eukprot:TRINITY_DN6540_c0_g1_i2.p1 TRINITY_DN6540_c0_g1~~TRINITY_DN6540_c0_g1_i2.p1  ORF type:complete len:397 (-),score=45.38 TRINITY_DN6540_c0_g1_i2:3-1193(-)